MDPKEAYVMLRHAGCTRSEIHRLMKFRREHSHIDTSLVAAENHRLEFGRWLFVHGRLTEYEENTEATTNG